MSHLGAPPSRAVMEACQSAAIQATRKAIPATIAVATPIGPVTYPSGWDGRSAATATEKSRTAEAVARMRRDRSEDDIMKVREAIAFRAA